MEIDINNVLPNNLIIPTAGSDFYRIGLSLFPYGNQRRFRFCNPILIFSVFLIQLFRSIISILLNSKNKELRLYLGDACYFLNIKIIGNLIFLCLNQLSLLLCLSHYYYYINDVKFSFMKPFDMMCGLVSPKSIDITNCDDIRKILKKGKVLFKYYYEISRFAYPWFCAAFLPLVLNCSVKQIFLFAFPWSVFHTLCTYYIININLCHFVYFYIVCYYLKLKLANINNNLKHLTEKGKLKLNHTKIKLLLNKLNLIYSEINRYNNYWSWFLFLLTFHFIFEIILNLFLILFNVIHSYSKLSFMYSLIVFTLVLFIHLFTASAIYYEAFKTYKILNTILLLINDKSTKFRIGFKVYKSFEFYNLF
jgi:hypothetical protein